MPYSLKQLKSQRDTYIKNIEELRASAEDKGAGSFGIFSYIAWDTGVTKKNCKRGKKRRECEVKIAKMMEEKRKKRQREFDEEPDTSKRMRLTGGNGKYSSQTMNWTIFKLEAIVFHLVVIFLLLFHVILARKYYNQRLD